MGFRIAAGWLILGMFLAVVNAQEDAGRVHVQGKGDGQGQGNAPADGKGFSALPGTGNGGEIDFLLGGLVSPDASVRLASVRALKEVRDEFQQEVIASRLKSILRDTVSAVRREVVESLASFHGRGATEALLEAASSPDLSVRLAAVRELGKMKEASLIQELSLTYQLSLRLKDEYSPVRQAAVKALLALTRVLLAEKKKEAARSEEEIASGMPPAP